MIKITLLKKKIKGAIEEQYKIFIELRLQYTTLQPLEKSCLTTVLNNIQIHAQHWLKQKGSPIGIKNMMFDIIQPYNDLINCLNGVPSSVMENIRAREGGLLGVSINKLPIRFKSIKEGL